MEEKLFIDLNCQQRNFGKEKVCGDVFLSKKLEDQSRIIAVLSDGMGYGVKANILATLASTIAMNLAIKYKSPLKVAKTFLRFLPVCKERKMRYASITLVDIDLGGEVNILEFNNPPVVVFRDGDMLALQRESLHITNSFDEQDIVHITRFRARIEDRMVFFSNGISQAGMGSTQYPFGWGHSGVISYVLSQIKDNPLKSSANLVDRMLNKTLQVDGFNLKDDASFTSIYFRKPRRLLLCTGPPFDKKKDVDLGKMVKDFDGAKVICGATTAQILSRELDLEVNDHFHIQDKGLEDPDLPPISYIESIDLVTEGILTLSKVSRILQNYTPQSKLGNGPAHCIVRMFLESDEIHMSIGTKINEAHQDPTLPVDLEIRRTVIRRISHELQNKLMKVVNLTYW